jgi:hypothetical protein
MSTEERNVMLGGVALGCISLFNFTDLDQKPVEREFSNDAPSWRKTVNGLNLEGKYRIQNR